MKYLESEVLTTGIQSVGARLKVANQEQGQFKFCVQHIESLTSNSDKPSNSFSRRPTRACSLRYPQHHRHRDTTASGHEKPDRFPRRIRKLIQLELCLISWYRGSISFAASSSHQFQGVPVWLHGQLSALIYGFERFYNHNLVNIVYVA
jgi:hypothetical protein